MKIKLQNSNKEAIVDAKDYAWAKNYQWYLEEETGYAYRWDKSSGTREKLYMHNEVVARNPQHFGR